MPKDPLGNRFNLNNGWPILLLIGVALIIFATLNTQKQPSDSLSQSESDSTTDQQNTGLTAIPVNEVGGTDSSNAMSAGENTSRDDNAQISNLIPAEKLVESRKPFTIQVYSVQDKPSAQRAVDGLRKAGHPAYFFKKDLKDKGIWFRVCVGRFDTKEEADQYLISFRNLHKESFIITTDSSHLRDTIKSFSN